LRIRPLIAIAAVILLTLAISWTWLQKEFETPYYNAAEPETYIDIARGSKTKEIADLLVKKGILHNRLPFILYLRFSNIGRQIQAGEYRFEKPATPEQIAKKLIRGDIYFHAVTVPEGLTAYETIDLLSKNGLGTPAGLQKALQQIDWIRDINPAAHNLEGYLFPDTYRFGRKDDSEKIIKAMLNQFRLKLGRILAQYPKNSGLSVSETVILASMIEKEVKKQEEGPIVASVYFNRIKRGMPLACDATIIYALKIAGVYNGNLRKSDLVSESPYNSYIHKNLPPGPISNPGANSLRAALNPAHTDYLYYVSRNDGTHQFSRDYQAHLEAVARFQPRGRRR
jgi:UPF0755 protein